MNKKGFTLMELLVTIIIIMIIAGYALFAYIDSLREAENTRAKAVLEMVHSGVERAELERGAFTNPAFSALPLRVEDFDGACPPRNSPDVHAVLARCGFIPRLGFDAMSYIFQCVGSPAGAVCTMRARPGVTVGARFAPPYCAVIDLFRGGKAVDATCP